MTPNLPHDYTAERAFEVYGRNEYTKWAIQSRLFDWPTPPFRVEIALMRTPRKYRERRMLGKGILCIFIFGYEDEPHFWLGRVWVGQGDSCWWREIPLRIRKFYLEGEFYGAD